MKTTESKVGQKLQVAMMNCGRSCGVDSETENEVHDALACAEADAQALADVRTLDEWAAQDPENPFATTRGEVDEPMRWCCWREGPPNERCYFYAPTPDAARHAAAEWVRGQARERMLATSQAAAEQFRGAPVDEHIEALEKGNRPVEE